MTAVRWEVIWDFHSFKHGYVPLPRVTESWMNHEMTLAQCVSEMVLVDAS